MNETIGAHELPNILRNYNEYDKEGCLDSPLATQSNDQGQYSPKKLTNRLSKIIMEMGAENDQLTESVVINSMRGSPAKKTPKKVSQKLQILKEKTITVKEIAIPSSEEDDIEKISFGYPPTLIEIVQDIN